MSNKLQITHESVIKLGETIIPCYVLEDGTRGLSSMEMQKALKMIEPKEGEKSPSRLPEFMAQKTLQPFIYAKKSTSDYEPIICYKGNVKYNLYEATILADICEAFLAARNSIKLSPRQAIIADQCEILIRGFARVGIIALIDEATGYQYDRERFELEKTLEAYIAKEAAKWQITFGLEFYRQIYRLWGVPFTPENIRRKPRFIAVLTIKYIYRQLPDGVYEKLKEVTPKNESGNYKYRLHQYLTSEIGKEEQKKIIHEVTALAAVSDSKKEFNDLFVKRFDTEPVQIDLKLNEDVEEQITL